MLMFKESIKDVRHLMEPSYASEQTNLQREKRHESQSRIWRNCTHKKVFLLVCFLRTKQRNQNKQSEKTSTQPDDDFNKTLNKTCKFYKTFVKVSEFNVSRYWITDYHQHIISSFCQSCCEHSSIPKYCCYALHVTSQGVTLMSTD